MYDILEIEPHNHQALVSLILSLTDQIPEDPNAFSKALTRIATLQAPYDRASTPGLHGNAERKRGMGAAAKARANTSQNGLRTRCDFSKRPNASA